MRAGSITKVVVWRRTVIRLNTGPCKIVNCLPASSILYANVRRRVVSEAGQTVVRTACAWSILTAVRCGLALSGSLTLCEFEEHAYKTVNQAVNEQPSQTNDENITVRIMGLTIIVCYFSIIQYLVASLFDMDVLFSMWFVFTVHVLDTVM